VADQVDLDEPRYLVVPFGPGLDRDLGTSAARPGLGNDRPFNTSSARSSASRPSMLARRDGDRCLLRPRGLLIPPPAGIFGRVNESLYAGILDESSLELDTFQ
jgi:hypothetical protein